MQYYSLASQKGEVEADMALSKWFLCGSGDVGNGECGYTMFPVQLTDCE